ncbi:3',5'-cyclic-nucleotide phosphodiesterase [Mucilaginibacter sp.]|uniref:MBL fold metallo-hydrolase n=1 Tax=Mucilaginibacter sp. TaxID=1882438 RepID=UPI0026069684|nr:3',5'-cyclic-nucleotide phosphodiesterase [Mucilaginibacter sp.]MDB5030175.1 cAMP phosphodiesterase class-II [Mucilaginibacter sp.]
MRFKLITILFLLSSIGGFTQSTFKIVPLGVLGGIDESNMSAYMVAPAGSNNYICMDAGTLHYGIEQAIKNKVFTIPAEQVLKKYIKGYFISHPHLDHISGLIINSPDDSTKSIYAFANCINIIKTHYFTWTSWANFANEGEMPQLKKYTYQVLKPGEEIDVANTTMKVTAFPLSHSNLTSTAFLIKSNNSYLLYLGDTGPDEIEKSNNLQALWQAITPLIKNHQLKGIMIEASFPNEQPDKTLFGHFTPKWLMTEMTGLSKLTGADALKNFNLVITHVKPPQVNINKLKAQLKADNSFGFNLIFPVQGKELDL